MVGKARGIGSDAADALSAKRNKWAGYAIERSAALLEGDLRLGEQSGNSAQQQSGINRDPRMLPREGGQMLGNVGWTLGTARLITGTNDLDLWDDGAGAGVNRVPAMIIVSLDSGTSGTLTTITGKQRDGQRLMCFGIAGNTITITHTAAGTADTITCPNNSNVTWSDDQVVEFVYDITTDKWRLVTEPASGGGGITFPITPTVNDHEDTWTSPVDIDLSLTTAHVNKFTLDGDLTLTFSNIPADETQIEFELEFLQDGTGGHTVTFPAEVVEVLTVAQAANKLTIFTFRVNDNTNVHAITTLAGDISGGGGENQTPWLTDIDADGFDLNDLSNILFRSTTATPASTDTAMWRAGDDMVWNIDDTAGTNNYFWQHGLATKAKLDLEELELRTTSGLLPNFLTFANSDTTPTDKDDAGNIIFQGFDSGGATLRDYVTIFGQQEEVTVATGIEGELIIRGMESGSLTDFWAFNFAGTNTHQSSMTILPASSARNLGQAASGLNWGQVWQGVGFYLEQAAADLAVSGYGQLWVDSTSHLLRFSEGNAAVHEFFYLDETQVVTSVKTFTAGVFFNDNVDLGNGASDKIDFNGVAGTDLDMVSFDFVGVGDVFMQDGQSIGSTATSLDITADSQLEDISFMFIADRSWVWQYEGMFAELPDRQFSMQWYRNDATPNDGDTINAFSFFGEDSAGNKELYASMGFAMVDVTTTSEDGRWLVSVNSDGDEGYLALHMEGSAGSVFGGGMLGFRDQTAVVAQTYTVTNQITDRGYNANAATVDELADVLATLLQDLDDMGIVELT